MPYMLHKKPLKRGIGRIRRRKRVKAPKRPKEKSISKLIKECDKIFSIQVRMKGAWPDLSTGEWLNKDYTTDYIAPVKKLHCGHYLSRYYKAARWDFDNCRPQSYMSNIHMRGDPIVFRAKLLEEIGEERLKAVETKRHQSIKLSHQFLEEKLRELQSRPQE